MSINPTEKDFCGITLEVARLNDQLKRKRESSINSQIQRGETTPQETLKKIEECFKKAKSFSGFLEPWGEGKLFLDSKLDRSAEALSKELRILKTICKLLHLESKSQVINDYVQKDSLEKIANSEDFGRSFLEFVPNKDLQTVRSLKNENWDKAAQQVLLKKINEKTAVRDLSFNEKSLKDFLKKNGKEVKHLNLEGFEVTDASLLDDVHQLQSLNLSKSDSGKEVLLSLICRKNLESLEDLDLSYNRIGDAGAIVLGAFLKECTKLERLSLGFCGITEITPIAEALGKKLRALVLEGNEIGDAGAIVLAAFLKECAKLEILNLDSCGIREIRPIAEALGEELRELYLYDNKIGDVGAIVLGSFLKECAKLERLALEFCGITEIRPIAEALGKEFRELYLSGNEIGDAGAIVLGAFLKECAKLERLSLGFCGITEIRPIAKALGKKLRALVLEGNEIGDARAIVLAAFLKECTKLEVLNLKSCGITEIRLIAEALPITTKLFC